MEVYFKYQYFGKFNVNMLYALHAVEYRNNCKTL
jgi:hypothetical protein